MNELLMSFLTMGEEEFKTTVKTYVDKYKPQVYALLGEMMGLYKDYINSEYFDVEAESYKRRFDALVGKGFTREEALALMIRRDEKLDAAVKSINAKKK